MTEGILLINKKPDWTSHDVVAKLRGLYGQKRIGHTGTLDPMATGLLPICIGRATRLAEYVSNHKKTYVVDAKTGFATNTYDITGERMEESPSHWNRENLLSVLDRYKGEIYQKPPMYSAIKYKGRKLYEYARKGEEVQVKERKITIFKLSLLQVQVDGFSLEVECSSGTYIRSLINDIGIDLKSYATMTALNRTRVGDFSLDESFTLEEIESMTNEERIQVLLPMDRGVSFLPTFTLSNAEVFPALNGQKIFKEDIDKDTLFRVYSKSQFIGIGESGIYNGEKYLKMKKVFR